MNVFTPSDKPVTVVLCDDILSINAVGLINISQTPSAGVGSSAVKSELVLQVCPSSAFAKASCNTTSTASEAEQSPDVTVHVNWFVTTLLIPVTKVVLLFSLSKSPVPPETVHTPVPLLYVVGSFPCNTT